MSSLAFPREAASRRSLREAVSELVANRAAEIVLGLPIALLAVVLLVQLPQEINVDSWLALVTGRMVWQTGIPHHETLTVMSHGIAWIDQQWLAQLASYAIYLVGGLGLLGVVNVGLLVSGIAIATFAARRLRAPFRSVLVALPACVAMVTPSREVRTQEFIVPLFMLLVYLLARDSREPSRRVFWCLPILVLWANLHGTVTMGAMLVALYGACVLCQRRHALLRSAREWRRPLALILGAGVSILLTPYGLAIVGYYRATMVNSTLRHSVTEWQPITSTPTTAVALFIVAGVALWSFGRNPSKTTTWEKLALLVLAVSAITIVRNALFFGLFALMIVPVSVAWGERGPQARSDSRRILINGTAAAIALGALALAAVATLVRPPSALEYGYQRPQVLAAVQRVTRADPSIRVMADERVDDWLLWRDPALSGRIANDVRFELLTGAQIQSLDSLFGQIGPGWKHAAHGYRLLVLDKRDDPGAFVTFRHEPGARVLYDDGERLVILRSAGAATKA
jgi:hypothetical protein